MDGSCVSHCEGALKPGIGCECAGSPLGVPGFARGFAQGRLEGDAEMRGQPSLLLVAKRVGQDQPDAGERTDEQCD
jgi:hypothetical protein